jgi:hypothetical protein
MRHTMICGLGLFALAACTTAQATNESESAPASAASAPTAPGQAASAQTAAAAPTSRSCVSIPRIREARVKDDQTIDFHLNDGTIYRSSLPHKCPQLGFEKAFTYSTSLTQLCSTDIIRVIHQGGGSMVGASCGLGAFVPISKEQADAKG